MSQMPPPLPREHPSDLYLREMTPADRQRWKVREIERCQQNPRYFMEKYLIIKDANGVLRRFKLFVYQLKLLVLLLTHRQIKILKARQIGTSTLMAAFFFWRWIFRPGHETKVTAHLRESATEVYGIYARFYEHLPLWMQELFPSRRGNKKELLLTTGQRLLVTTAGSAEARSSTGQDLHNSEFAHWANIEDAIAAIFATGAGDGRFESQIGWNIVETTALSFNRFKQFWDDTGSGYVPMFISWKADPKKVSSLPLPTDLDAFERAWLEEHGGEVSSAQASWYINIAYRKILFRNPDKCRQEYPSNPEEAFLTSGSPFFSVRWRVLESQGTFYGLNLGEARSVDYPWESEQLKREERLKPGRRILGIDTASGGEEDHHDYSAAVCLDVHPRSEADKVAAKPGDWDRPVSVGATMMWRMPAAEWAMLCYEMAVFWQALVVIEINGAGSVVMDYFVRKGYPYIYTRLTRDSSTGRYTKKFGFDTGGGRGGSRDLLLGNAHKSFAQGYCIHNPQLWPQQWPRLAAQMNNVQWNDSGKAEAPKPKKDDLVLAYALAYQGLEQYVEYNHSRDAQLRPEEMPTTIDEILKWEKQHKKKWAHEVRRRSQRNARKRKPDTPW